MKRACRNKDHRDAWKVIDRNCNYSAFNGYRRTPSDYSSVICLAFSWPQICAVWRTKANYVDTLPDATREEISGAR